MASRLQRALEIFDLQAYIEETFDDVLSAAEGEELRLNCFAPYGCARGDNKHKLYVNPNNKRWICFKCGYGTYEQPGTGSIVKFIADAENIPPLLVRHRLLKTSQPTPQEELEDILQGLFEPAPIPPKPEKRKINMGQGFFPVVGASNALAMAHKKYLMDRGMTEEEIQWYDVRFTVGSSGGPNWAKRAIFPIFDEYGILRSASGRMITNSDRVVRWWHWPNTDIDQLLWPICENKGAEDVVLTEGIFDALAVKHLTDKRALCTFGHKLSDGQIRLLKNEGTKRVFLAWDRDSKSFMMHAAQNLESNDIEALLIPFNNETYWQDHDLGDMISGKWSWDMEAFLLHELHDAFPVSSPKTVSWMVS